MSYLLFVLGVVLVAASLKAGWHIKAASDRNGQKKKTLLLFIGGIALLVAAQFTFN